MVGFSDDPVVRAAVDAMPEDKKGELETGDVTFLHGVLVGATKALSIASRMDGALREGNNQELLKLKSMLQSALLVVCKRVLKGDKRIIVPTDSL
jgi:hypothetical protein